MRPAHAAALKQRQRPQCGKKISFLLKIIYSYGVHSLFLLYLVLFAEAGHKTQLSHRR
jgi:hypothetical protein